MANYQIPPDPRKPDNDEKRPSRRQRSQSDSIPWPWLLGGVVVAIVGIALAIMLVNALLRRAPLPVAAVEPTLIVLTAPPRPSPSPTPPVATPSPAPTFTPIPTPDTAVAPPEITVGFYAEVANTDGIGVTVRGGPSTSNVPLLVADEGAILLVIGGPEEANEFLWWQVRLNDGTEGWVAGDFLLPAAEP